MSGITSSAFNRGDFLLYAFWAGLRISAVRVIGSTNPVHSILFLVVSFANGAGLLLSLGVELLGFLFLIVYVGAIAVLFLFVVRRLPAHGVSKKGDSVGYLPLGGRVAFAVACELLYVLPSGGNVALRENDFALFNWSDRTGTSTWLDSVGFRGNVEALAHVLYSTDAYRFPFLLSGRILLVARIGAIVLTRHRRGDVKRQFVTDQVLVDAQSVVALYTLANPNVNNPHVTHVNLSPIAHIAQVEGVSASSTSSSSSRAFSSFAKTVSAMPISIQTSIVGLKGVRKFSSVRRKRPASFVNRGEIRVAGRLSGSDMASHIKVAFGHKVPNLNAMASKTTRALGLGRTLYGSLGVQVTLTNAVSPPFLSIRKRYFVS